jgi:putative DNA primase/helicase
MSSPGADNVSQPQPMTFRPLTEEDLQQLPPKEQWESLGEWTIEPDREAAERFLSVLDPSTLNFTFQTFDDNADRKDKTLAQILHGSLDRHWDTLCRLNDAGAGIFVTINETNLKGRAAPDIVRVRALFVDIDDGRPLPAKFHVEPHIIVESSRNKWHIYWLVRDCPLDQFTALQERLIRAYDSDGKPKDLPRVLRLPGFIHEKVKDGVRRLPFRSDLAEARDRPAYAVEEAVAGLPEKEETKEREKAQAVRAMPWTAAEEARIRSALDAIPTDEATLKQEFGDSHEVWVNVGRAINRLGWGDQGFAIWDDWSKESPEYNFGGLLSFWQSFDRHRDDELRKGKKPITIGTVYFYAQRFGWDSGAGTDECAPAQAERNTDLGNARRLVRVHGTDLRYVHAWRSWLAWEDGHWRRDTDQAVMRRAKDVVEHMFEEAGQINDEMRRNALRAWALKSQEGKRLREMIGLAQSEIKVVLPVSRLDADPYLLGVKNGVVDLRTGEFREAQRSDYVTKRAGTAFDPHARCPAWKAFLRRILGDGDLFKDNEMIEYLQRAVGYLLTGLTVEEVLFVLWGTGANGKSTFRETLFALLGDYAIGADASLLITPKQGGGATPDLARLHGRRLVAVNETQQNDHLNEARVKFITSHDIITARNLYEAPFDFTPTHKTILTTNHKPIVRGADEGTWRRIHLLPFTKMIPVKERDLLFRERKLLPELPGILNWALEGLKAYQREGLNPPEAVRAATKEYREDMDIIGQWIEARCVLDPGAQATVSSLHTNYKYWAEDEVGFSISVNKFGRELRDRGFERTRDGRAKGFRGLKLRGTEK